MFWIQVSDAHFFKEGFVGVSFFLSSVGYYCLQLSGKLLTKRLLNARLGSTLARIYPLHLLTLLIAACIGGYVQYSDTTDWIKHLSPLPFLLQPFFPSADYFFSFNSPSWSFGVRTVILFLLPPRDSFLKQQAKTIGCTLSICLPVMLGMYLTADEQIKAYWYVNPITPPARTFLWEYCFIRSISHTNKKISSSTGTLLEVG